MPSGINNPHQNSWLAMALGGPAQEKKKSKQTNKKKQIKNLEPQERRIRWEKDGGIYIIGHILPLSVFSVGETQQEYTNISHPL